jgi:hypothetical protein
MRGLFAKALLLLLALAAPPARAASWEDEDKEWEKFSSTRFYKDPGYAAKLSLGWLPVDMGHFYVGDVSKGVWSSAGQAVALTALVMPVLNAQARSKRDKEDIWTGGMIATAVAGGLGYLGLKIWSSFDAAASARRYNEALAKDRQKQGWRLDTDGRRVILSRRW